VDLFESDRIPEKGQFKIKYGIKPEQKIILFVGRINKIKGVDLLIDAFFEITKEKSQYILVMVGPDDGYCSIIKKQIENLKLENNIIFTGTIFSKDKLNAYVDADVVVLPSEYEAFSNVILEAWSCGTLIIVSENCKLAEIVKKAGYVSKSDKFHLKEVIIFATNNEELKTKFIDEGKKIITREFNSDIIIKKIEKIYENVIMNNY
jgi:glycosyltransferase involved in cell wall biosynthesis